MSAPKNFDVIVIGAGPAGEVLAGRLADAGQSVAIVDAELVGGECSYYACMPSKALLRPAQAVAEARRVPGAAQAVTGPLDVEAVLTRRDEMIHDLDDSGQVPWLESLGVALIRGHGRLDGERQVQVDDELYEAACAVVVAVGSRTALPPVDGLVEVQPWTNREITTTKTVPARLIILGGGVVAVEMAAAFRSLGSDVVVLERGDRLVARVESFASQELLEGLRERGIDVRLGRQAKRLSRDGGIVHVELADGSTVDGDEILVAAGREPLTNDLGLEAVGLTLRDALDEGFDARAYDVPSSGTAGASFHGRDVPGTSRIVIDEDRGVIVGATFVGAEVAEWLHAASIAIVGETPVERLWEAIPAFPTRSEVWLKLLEAREEARIAESQLATAAN